MDTTPDKPAEETWEDIPEEIIGLSTDEILTRIRLIDNDLKVRSLCWSMRRLNRNFAVHRLCVRRLNAYNTSRMS